MGQLNPAGTPTTIDGNTIQAFLSTDPSKPETPTQPKKLYRVQVGAFSIKANADAMLAKVKAAGFPDAYIKIE
ncbi:SPOR domain-containing protein, partial [Dehalococcoides sp. THU3]|uniref:SPOR domain-containing protein n=1 Tax=Dehalococcoides sp. THU3 TaxID=3151601 RepID=UPI003218968B